VLLLKRIARAAAIAPALSNAPLINPAPRDANGLHQFAF
jgi:hypothetical protein